MFIYSLQHQILWRCLCWENVCWKRCSLHEWLNWSFHTFVWIEYNYNACLKFVLTVQYYKLKLVQIEVHSHKGATVGGLSTLLFRLGKWARIAVTQELQSDSYEPTISGSNGWQHAILKTWWHMLCRNMQVLPALTFDSLSHTSFSP